MESKTMDISILVADDREILVLVWSFVLRKLEVLSFAWLYEQSQLKNISYFRKLFQLIRYNEY